MLRSIHLFARITTILVLFIIPLSARAQNKLLLSPQPKKLTQLEGIFQFKGPVKIYISQKAGDETHFSFEELSAEIKSCYSLEVKENRKFRSSNLRIGLTGRDKQLDKELKSRNLKLPDDAKEEGYILQVTGGDILIAAQTETGLFYGVQTLKQLIRGNSHDKTIPSLTIIDWPSLRYRGWMDDISRGPIPTIAFLKECIRKMAEYKQNYFTLYTEHVFKLKKYPDIAPPDGLTVDEVKELTEYASHYHIDLIGNFQSFGHFAKILANPFYTHLGENSDILNPADESSYDFLKGVYSEIVPSYKSPFFNINCDETFGLGEGKSKAMADKIGIDGIYSYHINRIDQLVKPYGKRIMMWGDIAVNNPGIISKLPKDLIILSWGYHAAESFDNAILPFKNTGFDFMVAPGVSCWNEVWPGMLNAAVNISNYVRDGYKLGAMGMMNTAWDDNGHNLFNSNWHGLAWGAESSWNPLPDATPDIAVIQRNKALQEFNKSFDKLFFNADGITGIMMSIDSIRNFPVPGILNEWAFWNDILEFNSTNTTNEFIEANQNVITKAELLSNQIQDYLKLNPDNTEMIDNARFALNKIIFTAKKNIVRGLLFETKKTGDPLLIAQARDQIKDLRDQLFSIKKQYISLWNRENRNCWLDKNLNDYNLLAGKLDDAGNKVFIESSTELTNESLTVKLRNIFKDGSIVYTLDGTEPTVNSPEYHDSLTIHASTLIKARLVRDGISGPLSEQYIAFHKGIGCLHRLKSRYSTYNTAYTAGGDLGLLDGLKGSSSFYDGRWQGYQGQDLDIEIDLKEINLINDISINFLQSAYSWILLPKDVEILVSNDGINYKTIKLIEHNIPTEKNETLIYNFKTGFEQLRTRFVRIIAHNPGPLPVSHHAAGNQSFIFADEIIIN